MPKKLDLTQIEIPHGNIRFNQSIGTEESPSYTPIQIRIEVIAMTSDGKGRNQSTTVESFGTPRATPFETETAQGRRELHDAIPAVFRPLLRAAVEAALDEDPSE